MQKSSFLPCLRVFGQRRS